MSRQCTLTADSIGPGAAQRTKAEQGLEEREGANLNEKTNIEISQ
jgi:hypothetical protein